MKPYKSGTPIPTEKETDLEWSVHALDEITHQLHVEKHMLLTTEKDNDGSLSRFNLCEAAWHCTVLKALEGCRHSEG